MTRKDYIKLVQESGAFQKMDKETQNKILTAKGADFRAFAKIFAAEQDEIMAAKKEFITTTVEIMDGFEKETKIIIKVERKKKEEKAVQEDEVQSEKLLSEINKL